MTASATKKNASATGNHTVSKTFKLICRTKLVTASCSCGWTDSARMPKESKRVAAEHLTTHS